MLSFIIALQDKHDNVPLATEFIYYCLLSCYYFRLLLFTRFFKILSSCKSGVDFAVSKDQGLVVEVLRIFICKVEKIFVEQSSNDILMLYSLSTAIANYLKDQNVMESSSVALVNISGHVVVRVRSVIIGFRRIKASETEAHLNLSCNKYCFRLHVRFTRKLVFSVLRNALNLNAIQAASHQNYNYTLYIRYNPLTSFQPAVSQYTRVSFIYCKLQDTLPDEIQFSLCTYSACVYKTNKIYICFYARQSNILFRVVFKFYGKILDSLLTLLYIALREK